MTTFTPCRTCWRLLALACAALLGGCQAATDLAPLCEGDVYVRNAGELQDFLGRRCSAVSGWLHIGGRGLGSVSLPDLAIVGWLEVYFSEGLRSVSLPTLEAIEGSGQACQGSCPPGLTVSGNPDLERLEFPSLRGVGGGLRIESNGALAQLNAPALVSLGGELSVADNLALPACQALSLLARLREAGYSGRASIARNGTSWACPGLAPCQGDVVIGNSQDWAALVDGGCTEVAGNLTISPSGAASLSGDPPLEAVGGLLRVTQSPTLEHLSLPALARVGGLELAGNAALVSLDLPALLSAAGPDLAGDLSVHDNPALVDLGVPALAVAGGIQIARNPALRGLELPALAWCREIQLDTNPALADVSAPRLGSVSTMVVTDNPVLASIGLPALETVGEQLRIDWNSVLAVLDLPRLSSAGRIELWNDPALRLLNLPALSSAGAVDVQNNPGLGALSLPVLSSAGAVSAYGNRALASFSAPALDGPPGSCVALVFGEVPLVELSLPAVTSACGFQVQETTRLATVDAPLLRSAEAVSLDRNQALELANLGGLTAVLDWLSITDNPVLPQCWAEALLRQLRTTPPAQYVFVAGNDAAAICQP